MSAEREIKIKNLEVIIPSGKNTRLRWKEFQILSLLVNRSPELVSRAEIIENIWKGTYCSDSTINQTIKSIRQKIGDGEHSLIRTIPRLGYKVDDKNIFHFILEAESIMPGNEDDNHGELDEIYLKEGEIADASAIAESYPSINSSLKTLGQAYCKQTQTGWYRMGKYLAVFISLLTVSLLSYALGSRTTKPALQYERLNNARLVLSLELPASSQPLALNCIYHKGLDKEMRVSCSAP